MRRLVTFALLTGSVPVGVVVGVLAAHRQGPPACLATPGCTSLYMTATFPAWLAGLFGALAAMMVLTAALALTRPSPLVGALAVGTLVGVWTSMLMSWVGNCAVLCFGLYPMRSTFTTWQCAVFGAGAMALVLLIAWAADRRSPLRLILRQAQPAR